MWCRKQQRKRRSEEVWVSVSVCVWQGNKETNVALARHFYQLVLVLRNFLKHPKSALNSNNLIAFVVVVQPRRCSTNNVTRIQHLFGTMFATHWINKNTECLLYIRVVCVSLWAWANAIKQTESALFRWQHMFYVLYAAKLSGGPLTNVRLKFDIHLIY